MFENIGVLLFCMFIDITITYYYFFLMDKKNCFDLKQERGFIANKLFKHFGRSPASYVFHYFFTACIIMLYFYLFPYLNNIPFYLFQQMDWFKSMFYLSIGLYSIVLWKNFDLIFEAKRNWNNNVYWKAKKAFSQARI